MSVTLVDSWVFANWANTYGRLVSMILTSHTQWRLRECTIKCRDISLRRCLIKASAQSTITEIKVCFVKTPLIQILWSGSNDMVCMLMAQFVCWWQSTCWWQFACWWHSLHVGGCLHVDHLCWWHSLHVDGTVCMLMAVYTLMTQFARQLSDCPWSFCPQVKLLAAYMDEVSKVWKASELPNGSLQQSVKNFWRQCNWTWSIYMALPN